MKIGLLQVNLSMCESTNTVFKAEKVLQSLKRFYSFFFSIQIAPNDQNVQLTFMKVMKSFSILFAIFAVWVLVSCQQLDPNYSFADYVVQFNKQYDDQQYPVREAIFDKNYQYILELEAQENGECHFQVNNYTDWTDQEKAALLGYNKPEGIALSSLPPKLKSNPGSLTYPASLDYRDLDAVSSVKNQGNCGSCWAFSATALYESMLMIETGVEYDLSEQFILQCSGSSNDCDGGFPIQALQKMEANGIPLEASYPYRANDNYYSSICSTTSFVSLTTPILNTQHYGYLSDAQIKQLLFDYGPLSIGIYVNSAFSSYSYGVFSLCPSSPSVNHAVLLIGYTDNGHWIIKNSWGLGWGMNGFGIIHKDSNCGLNTWVDVMEIDWPEEDDDNDDNDENIDPNNFTMLQYKVYLTDSSGDGWHGLSLGVKQEGQYMSTFGSDFSSGSSYGPISFNIKSNRYTILEVVALASYTHEVGFTIFDQKDNLIFSRCAGSSFTSDIIFYQWCPSEQCVTPSTFNLSIMMTDTWGDGWNGNAFGLKQNGQIVATFGQDFTSGSSLGPVIKTVQRNVMTSIVVSSLGSWRSQVRFTIKNTQGDVLFAKTTSNTFSANSIIGTFCPGCTNTANVRSVPISQSLRVQKPITDPNDPNYSPPITSVGSQNPQFTNYQSETQKIELILVSSILGFFVLLFLVISIIFFILWKNERKFYSKGTTVHTEQAHMLQSPENVSNKPKNKIQTPRKQHMEATTNHFDIHGEEYNIQFKPEEEHSPLK